MSSEESEAQRQQWRDWADASGVSWEWFCTLTFRYRKDYVKAEKAFHSWIREVAVTKGLADGLTKSKAKKLGLPFVATVEPHKAGGTHIHAVVGGVGGLSPQAFCSAWKKRFGDARIEPCAEPDACLIYVLKWVGKVGEPLACRELGRPPAPAPISSKVEEEPRSQE